MPLMRVTVYEVRCDGVGPDGAKPCPARIGPRYIPREVMTEARKQGWGYRGWGECFCPRCIREMADAERVNDLAT